MRGHALGCGIKLCPGGAGLFLHRQPGFERAQPHPDCPRRFDAVEQGRADHALRHAIDLGGNDDLVGAGLGVAGFRGRRHRAFGGHQEARAHGDADGAIGQRGGKATAIGKASGGDDRHLHIVEHLRQQHRRRHRSGVAAAFAALHGDHVAAEFDHLLRVLHRTHGRDAQDAGIAKSADHLFVRAAPEADGAHLLLVGDDEIDDFGSTGLEHVEIDAERPVGEAAQRGELGARFRRLHHRGAEETKGPGVAGGGDQLRLRHPAHRGLDDRIAAAQPLGQHGGERISHFWPAPWFRPTCWLRPCSCHRVRPGCCPRRDHFGHGRNGACGTPRPWRCACRAVPRHG